MFVYVRNSDIQLVDAIRLLDMSDGYIDGDLHGLILRHNPEVVEELESMGIPFFIIEGC